MMLRFAHDRSPQSSHAVRSARVSATAAKRPPQPWRENIEALTVAIVMAVMLKYFAVEAYQIPTGSMQPTLMGQDFRPDGDSPGGAIKDRILVDKFSFHMRDPERWEVVIFKYPLNRAQNFVKRLVGMPGEQLKIQYGDVWTRPDASAEWKIARRPANVQREHWKAVDVGTPANGASWRALEGKAQFGERSAELTGPARVVFSAHGSGSILDTYTHGYPQGVRAALEAQGGHYNSNRNAVGDLRVTGKLTLGAGARVAVVLGEGKRSYRFNLAGPTPGIEVGWAPNEQFDARSVTASGAANSSGEFAVENLDDQLRLEFGGWELTLPVPPAADQSSSVTLEVLEGSASFSDLQVWRDVHYSAGSHATEWAIPAEHYFMLGDNTQDSSDSREWQAIYMKWRDAPGGAAIAGNYRGSPGTGYRPDSNPIRERGPNGLTTFFRDVYGELHVFPTQDEVTLPQGEALVLQPFVPRRLITGRAVAVFWPLSLQYSAYRVKWIR